MLSVPKEIRTKVYMLIVGQVWMVVYYKEILFWLFAM